MTGVHKTYRCFQYGVAAKRTKELDLHCLCPYVASLVDFDFINTHDSPTDRNL